ncbi:YqaE/Pmp3 family membrane protein [bacterium]|nr:YqaE/Pmp3 family membrane protein [bacterium]
MAELAPQHSRTMLFVIAIFLPPVAVYLRTRDWLHTVVSIILTLLLWLPGFLHSLYFVFRKKSSS